MIDPILSLWLRRSRAVTFVVKTLSDLVAAVPRYALAANSLLFVYVTFVRFVVKFLYAAACNAAPLPPPSTVPGNAPV